MTKGTHDTTWDHLSAHGLTHDIGDYLRGEPGCAQVVATATDDGPLVGLSYNCAYAPKEEAGVPALRTALANTQHPNSFLALFHDRAEDSQQALVSEIGDHMIIRSGADVPVVPSATQAMQHIERAEPRAQGSLSVHDLLARSRADLVTMAAGAGLPVSGRATKADLAAALVREDTPQRPHLHAAWFAQGDLLVLRREAGAYGLVIDRLLAAARAGALAVGEPGVASFGTGLTLFDSRDLGPLTQARMIEEADQRDRWMADLAPVAADLKAGGFSWFALGYPHASQKDGQVRYWLNGDITAREDGSHGQPFGWFTLEELRERRFLGKSA